MATLESPSNRFSDICAQVHMVTFSTGGKLWDLAPLGNLCGYQKMYSATHSWGLIPPLHTHKILYAQAYQEPQPTVLQFVQIPPASVNGNFPMLLSSLYCR